MTKEVNGVSNPNLKLGVQYLVTTPSYDGTFGEGDKICTIGVGSINGYVTGRPISISGSYAISACKGMAVTVDRDWVRKVCREILHGGSFAYQAKLLNIDESIMVQVKEVREVFESVVENLAADLSRERRDD